MISNILFVSILYPWLMTTVLNVSCPIYFDNGGLSLTRHVNKSLV